MDIVPGGTELQLQLRRGAGQAAHTRNNPDVNFRLASYKDAGHRSRYVGRLQLEHKAVTHCSRDKHLKRPHINKKK